MRLCDVNVEACSEKLAVFLSLRYLGGGGGNVEEKAKIVVSFPIGLF